MHFVKSRYESNAGQKNEKRKSQVCRQPEWSSTKGDSSRLLHRSVNISNILTTVRNQCTRYPKAQALQRQGAETQR